MSEKTVKMIRIKWVRSGIGFSRRQKTVVRSLGLNKLNQTVVRPDTPQIRGIVAAVPHLLQIVSEPTAPAWAAIPEYTIHAPIVAPAAPAETTAVETVEAPGEPVAVAEPAKEDAAPAAAKAPKALKAKPAKAGEKKKASPKASKPAKARKE